MPEIAGIVRQRQATAQRLGYCLAVQVELNRINVAFGSNSVLQDLNLTIPRGISAAIVGQSGAGKTTLLRLIAGFVAPTSGIVLVDGISPRKHYGRGDVGFLFQETCLFPHLTLEQNVGLAALAKGEERAHFQQVLAKLRTVGLEHAANLFPFQASVGMRARAAIARTLCFPPKLLLMDEPFAALDPVRRTELNRLIRQECSAIGATSIWTTHSVAEALVFADAIIAITPDRNVRVFDATHLPTINDEGCLPQVARDLRDTIIASTWPAATSHWHVQTSQPCLV